MSPARLRIPPHLQPYVVEQVYARYSAEDQAVWRYILRQLKSFLSEHAHEAYKEGLSKTGISLEQIPRIDDIDQRLSEFGWGAVPVSGFIPPAAFMEFQSLGILPIASDMRSIDHLAYTPAPDIVHEAAGHAPILINPEFAAYLKRYAEVARNAIISREDMDQYGAIRALSDVKENPDSTAAEIKQAEDQLNQVNTQLTTVSEAGWLSRMNWWTAEYGLIGSIENPKIFGAGLLSSVAESRECLSAKVRKVPLSLECIETSYDITEPQPQLFVTPNFEHLIDVLEQLAPRMAFRLGGLTGLKRAQAAATVCTAELDSGLQISGVVDRFTSHKEFVDFLRFKGPVALAYDGQQLPEHGREQHAHGFSTPLGRITGFDRPLTAASDSDLAALGIKKGQRVKLEFASGLELEADVVNWRRNKHRLYLIQFTNAKLTNEDLVLYDPSWGPFDMAVGEKVISVFGGAADRPAYGTVEEITPARVPARLWSDQLKARSDFYADTRSLRSTHSQDHDRIWLSLLARYHRDLASHWLPAVELIEVARLHRLDHLKAELEGLSSHLGKLAAQNPNSKTCIEDGLKLAGNQ